MNNLDEADLTAVATLSKIPELSCLGRVGRERNVALMMAVEALQKETGTLQILETLLS